MNVSILGVDLSNLQRCSYIFPGEKDCQLYSIPCNDVKDCSRKEKLIQLAEDEDKVFDNGFIRNKGGD